MAHFSETCDDDTVHLIAHTHTTPATVHEAQCTEVIHEGLGGKGLLPREHLIDSAYIAAELIVSSRDAHGIALIGPPRPDSSWQSKVEGAYNINPFAIDWDHQQMRCPQGKVSVGWQDRLDYAGHPYIQVSFRTQDCQACDSRAFCTRTASGKPCVIKLQPRLSYAALLLARTSYERKHVPHVSPHWHLHTLWGLDNPRQRHCDVGLPTVVHVLVLTPADESGYTP